MKRSALVVTLLFVALTALAAGNWYRASSWKRAATAARVASQLAEQQAQSWHERHVGDSITNAGLNVARAQLQASRDLEHARAVAAGRLADELRDTRRLLTFNNATSVRDSLRVTSAQRDNSLAEALVLREHIAAIARELAATTTELQLVASQKLSAERELVAASGTIRQLQTSGVTSTRLLSQASPPCRLIGPVPCLSRKVSALVGFVGGALVTAIVVF